MQNLFSEEKIIIPLSQAAVEYFPTFFSSEKADTLFEYLYNNIPWQQDSIKVYGKNYRQPRLTALFGNEGKSYKYSNILMQPHPWNNVLMDIKNEIEEKTHQKFTTVLLNLYRNEKDSNGWHADNEKELGTNPIIASVSFGEERVFQIKHNTNSNEKQNIILQHGSLLLMKEGSQIHYKHQIPKATNAKKPRINLTFRFIY